MIVVTYYTNDAYKALADRMMASAEKLGLRTKGYFFDNKDGSWKMGMNGKPSVVLRALEENPGESVLFVDADCRFISYPFLLDDNAHDHNIACVFNGPQKPTSTVLWLRAKAGLHYAKHWVEDMKKHPGELDDYISLWNAVNKIVPKRMLHLPPAYAWTEEFHRPRFGAVVPVIEHFAVGEHITTGFNWGKSKHTIFKDDRG